MEICTKSKGNILDLVDCVLRKLISMNTAERPQMNGMKNSLKWEKLELCSVDWNNFFL